MPPPSVILFVSTFMAGEAGAIRAFHLNPATGAVAATGVTVSTPYPFFMAPSFDSRTLYSIESKRFGGKDPEPADVVAWRIVDRDGRLTRLGAQSCRGTVSCYLESDPSGRVLLVANYGTGSVASLPITPDGSLGAIVGFAAHAGGSTHPTRQTMPHAHAIIPGPAAQSGRQQFAYATDLGTDEIRGYIIDPATAKLQHHPPASAKAVAGSGPRHLRFHPAGHTLYVLNELIGSVTAYAYEASSGQLAMRQTVRTLPDDFKGESLAADLRITPDGRFLYASNRGHDTIAIFRLDAVGELERIDIVPSRGKGPQNLAITSDGMWLLCANMASNNLVVFRIDADTGRLTATGTPTGIESPSCVVIVPPPTSGD